MLNAPTAATITTISLNLPFFLFIFRNIVFSISAKPKKKADKTLMKLFSKKSKPLAIQAEGYTVETLHPIMREWLKTRYSIIVSEEQLNNFVKSYYDGSSINICVWNSKRKTSFWMKLVAEERRNQTDSHYLYFQTSKKGTDDWEFVIFPSKEDVTHFNPVSHKINVARQMLREQFEGTYDAYLPAKELKLLANKDN